MGYYVSGYMEVNAKQEHLNALALTSFDALKIDPQDRRIYSQDPMGMLLAHAGFESIQVISNEPTDKYDVKYVANFDGKWWSEMDNLLNLMASTGASLDGSFVGEDNEKWLCVSAYNQGSMETISMVPVPYPEYIEAKKAKNKLEAVEELIAKTSNGQVPVELLSKILTQ